MKFYTIIAFLSLALVTNGFAQEQYLGMSKQEMLDKGPYDAIETLEEKHYPLIKETFQLAAGKWAGIGRGVNTIYLFTDSSDKVCRVHMVYNDLTADDRQKIVNSLTEIAKCQLDKTDKKHTTYIGRTAAADYILTWAKDKNRKATYLLVTDYGYKLKMLNHLVNGGTLPDDGIFTPAPSK